MDAIKVRRALIAGAVTALALGVNWFTSSSSSPLHPYFLYHVSWPNLWMMVCLPGYILGGLVSGNLHGPPTWAGIFGFLAQWLAIGAGLSLLLVRRARP
jgi:hypothetical protein